MLRVTLTPIVQAAPFVGGMSLSWLETPMIDFDVRGLGGADLMSLPAVADWIMSSVVSGYVAGMVTALGPRQTASQIHLLAVFSCRSIARLRYRTPYLSDGGLTWFSLWISEGEVEGTS